MSLILNILFIQILYILLVLVFLALGFGLSYLFFKLALCFKNFPGFSKTEKVALAIGGAGIEKSFFSSGPSLKALFRPKYPVLSQEEKSFLNQETEKLCSLSTEWEFLKKRELKLQEEDFLKQNKFFGLTVPKSYQGREFSPLAHAKVIEKIASHNLPLSIIVMVPNSLGPAELLVRHGTQQQKQAHLSDLATGEKWPCFALTETLAGSDATALKSEGVLFKEGDSLKIRLHFEKRWISLATKSDLMALAVQLKDPQQLYSQKKDLGISCVLISRHLKGIQIEGRHDPMGLPLYNAPIKGQNVVVEAKTALIGGLKNAGKGWDMLVESLSVGRGISLPSLSIAAAKRTAWLTGTHAFVRRQFGLPIGKLKALQEPLAFIAGSTHLMAVTQKFYLSALNQGLKSPVISALIKYQLTQRGQKVVKKGMNIMGGAGLSLGPKNKMALLHNSLPLAITVEGANSLTRSLMVYGQALVQLHPFIYPLIQSIEQKNYWKFCKNFWVFIVALFASFFKMLIFFMLYGLMGLGFFILELFKFFYSLVPNFAVSKTLALKIFAIKKYQYWFQLKLSTALFCFLNNCNFLVLGKKLKKEGQFMGRFSDLLSGQYMLSALLWDYHHKGQKQSWGSLVTQWGIEHVFAELQACFVKILQDYPNNFIRFLLKPFLIFLRIQPLSCGPSDSLNHKLALKLLLEPKFKKALCENSYQDPTDPIQKLNRAYELSLKEEQIKTRAPKTPKKTKGVKKQQVKKECSKDEQELFKQARIARYEALQVDVFSDKEYFYQ